MAPAAVTANASPSSVSQSCSSAMPITPTSAPATTSATSDPALVDDRFAKRNSHRVRACVGLELREDVPHVALDGLLADEELRRDIGVRHAVREQLEDLALARGEHVLALAGQERGHQRRVDVPLSGDDLFDRPQQSLVWRLLEDVALRARLEAAAQEAALAERGEDEDGRVRDLLAEQLRRFEPIHARHTNVHDHD